MTNCRPSPGVDSVGCNLEAIFCSAGSFAASSAKMADDDMASKMANVCVPDLRKIESTIKIQETSNLSMTNEHADDVPASRKNDEFLNDKNILYVTHSEVQGMINSAMLTYEKLT